MPRYNQSVPLSAFQKATIYPGFVLGAVALAITGGYVFGAGAILGLSAQASYALVAGSTTYLSGVGYGVLNDVLATGYSLIYFSRGHRPDPHNPRQGFTPINSDNRFANAFAWGFAATVPLVVVASIGIGFYAYLAFPVASFFLPALMLGALTAVGVGEIIAARFTKNALENNPSQTGLDFQIPFYDHQTKQMLNTPSAWANWQSCGARNSFGYIGLPLLVLGIVAITSFGLMPMITVPVLLTKIVWGIGAAIFALGVRHTINHSEEGRTLSSSVYTDRRLEQQSHLSQDDKNLALCFRVFWDGIESKQGETRMEEHRLWGQRP